MAPLQTSLASKVQDSVTSIHDEFHDFSINDDMMDTNTEMSPMQSFYKDKTIFLTGATGFFGKIIMEKLLRTCDVASIYILVRSKKGKDVNTRIEEIFNDTVFCKLRELRPKFHHKIVGIIGDCASPGLGISDSDREMIQKNVQIVFHVAATVRFDESLKLAVAINVNATKEMMEISRGMPNLKAHVHVSTAYANCPNKEINERFYEPRMSGFDAIKMANALDETTLNACTPHIIGEWPNTYTFTKSLAEDVVRNMSKGLPVTVFRPAIVIGTAKEPIEGWIDNLYGPTGLIVGIGTGLIRVVRADKSTLAELVPVDLCVNSLLASAWDISKNQYDEPPVYNYVASPENPLKWEEYAKYGVTVGKVMPITKSIWHYTFTIVKSSYMLTILTFLYHTLPAIAMDFLLLLIGKRPKLKMVYRKLDKFVRVITYFAVNKWKFTNDNTQELWSKLDSRDKELFYFSMKDIEWSKTVESGFMGCRTYLAKEDPSTIPAARKRQVWLKILHYVTIYSIYAICLYVFYKIFRLFK